MSNQDYGQQDQYNQGNQGQQDQYNQGNQGGYGQQQDQYNQGNQGNQGGYGQQQDQYNQGNQGQQDQYNQGNQGQQDQYNQGNQGQQQQGHGNLGGARGAAQNQVDQAIDQFGNKIPGGTQYTQQAKDAAHGVLDNLEKEGENRLGNFGGGMFGGNNQ
ncbi:MAG: hypothetical protein PVSMB2_01320 [Ktedonobacteraceae bacterium]